MISFKPDIVEILAGTLVSAGAITIAYFKNKIKDWYTKKLNFLFSEKTFKKEDALKVRKINDLLVELRVATNADRAYIFKFHNGDTFSIRDPIWKLTCSNETVRSGISYEIHNLRNILVSSVIDFVLPLFSPNIQLPGMKLVDHTLTSCDPICANPKNIFICNIEDMEDSSSKTMLLIQGIKFLVMTPLEYNNKIMGFIGLDFCSTAELNYKEIVPKLCSTESLIGFITYGKS